MISQRDDPASIQRARRLGAHDYLGKNLTLADVAHHVQRALTRRPPPPCQPELA
jgi:DNA-binding NarL/FixJ family response regulator